MSKSLREKIKSLNKPGSFLKNVGILAGGTAFSQIIVVLSLPILTRFYSPDDFSALAVFIAIFSIFSSIACLRFEIAIPLVKTKRDAVMVVVLASGSCLFVTLITALIMYCSYLLGGWGSENFSTNLYWLVPFGVFVSGVYLISQYWITREKDFSFLAINRISRTVGAIFIQLIGGWLSSLYFLLIGQIFIQSGVGFRLIKRVLSDIGSELRSIKTKEMYVCLKENKRFAIYSTPEILLNSAATYLPIIIMAQFVVGPELGFLMLATKIMGGPVTLVGSALSQVYLSFAGSEKRDTGNISAVTLSSLTPLLKFGVPFLIIFAFSAPRFFGLVFGEKWVQAGEMVLWMLPWFIMKLLSSPVSMALHVVNRQDAAFLLQLSGFIIRCGSVFLAVLYFPSMAVFVFAISGGVFYFLYVLVILHISKVNLHDFAKLLFAALPQIFLAAVISTGIYFYF